MRRALQACMFLAVAALLSACGPSVSEGEARALAAVAPELFAHPVGDIAPPWPAAVTELEPNRVYRSPEGVKIETWEFFVEAQGVFLLDPSSSFVPSRESDPAYEQVSGNVFTYYFRG